MVDDLGGILQTPEGESASTDHEGLDRMFECRINIFDGAPDGIAVVQDQTGTPYNALRRSYSPCGKKPATIWRAST